MICRGTRSGCPAPGAVRAGCGSAPPGLVKSPPRPPDGAWQDADLGTTALVPKAKVLCRFGGVQEQCVEDDLTIAAGRRHNDSVAALAAGAGPQLRGESLP
jgi:hypothetical protein